MKTAISLPPCSHRALGQPGSCSRFFPWLLLTLWVAVLPLSAAALRLPQGSERPPVLILYTTWQQVPHPTHADIVGLDVAQGQSLQVAQLLGHFPFAAQRVRFSDYRPGMLARYPYAFILVNRQNAVLPAPFLRDIRRYRGACYWINGGLDQVGPAFLQQLGMAYQHLDTDSGYNTVRYRGMTLGKGDAATQVIRITAPGRCHVLAQALNEKRTATPYLVRSGQFWYIADLPLEYAGIGDRYFAFADSLFDFFGVHARHPNRAFLRIEDINVTDNQAQLRAMADQFARLRVPFLMAVIPRYQDASSAQMDRVGIKMTSVPGYAATLRYMTARGGSVVMHGWNHRYHGASGIDTELWNPDSNQARPDDSVALVESHLRHGLQDCFAARIYPLAWEAPHYDASMLDDSVIARHFSTAVEQRGLLNTPDFGQFFPFDIRRDIFGQQIFPENLGYIEGQYTPDHKADLVKDDQEVDAMIRNAKTLSGLREVTLGAFIHPFIPPSLAARLVRGLKQAGYTFLDLRTEQNTVQLDDMLVASGTVHSQLRLHRQYLHDFFLDAHGQTRREHYSRKRMTGIVPRTLTVPPGWVYVCRGEG